MKWCLPVWGVDGVLVGRDVFEEVKTKVENLASKERKETGSME